MNQTELRDKLRSAPIFREFADRDFDELFALLDPVDVSAGTIIVEQDDPGDAMFIVVEGRCRVVHHKDGRDIELAVLKSGDFFGEIALVDEGPRSADVIAITDVSALKITQAAVSALAGVYPSAAFKLLIAIGRIMVTRLRTANRRYVDTLLFALHGKD